VKIDPKKASGASRRAPSDFTAGFFDAGDDRRRCAFESRTYRNGEPALIASVDAERVLIGPLSVPGRAGCAHCAHERIRAAEAVHDPRRPATQRARAVARRVMKRELRAIADGGMALLDHVLAVDVRSGAESMHRVIPLSRCRICGGAAGASPVALLDGWVDPVTGVISAIHLDSETELPIVVTAAPPHVFKDDGTLRQLPIGWGKGLTRPDAILSAVGEAIERYSASLPDPTRIVWRRPRDLKGDVLDPREFALYAEEQYRRKGFPYARFNAAIQQPWVGGTWLDGGGEVWVPAVFAFLSLQLRAEQWIVRETSNGLASWTDGDQAALHAVLELVERDAFLSAWMTATPGRAVTLDDALDPLLRRVLDAVEALGAAIEVFTLPTSACGTTVLCLARGDGQQYPGATIALAADLDPAAALRGAILELGQTAPHLRRMMQSRAIAIPAREADVRGMLDHAAYYFSADRATAFDFLRGAGTISVAELTNRARPRTLAACTAALRKAKVRVALVDVTSPDVATGPFRVVRAVSPDLQPLSYGYGFERLPVDRVRRRGLAAGAPAVHPVW
jgi:ribosomal protein S12 methylthiotransferase accessory factor